jgi:pimeloyl-ACP methyl ester carboxylesterase
MPTARVGATTVGYRLTGDGPVTVFITPGLGRPAAEWWPVQDALSDRARVLTWDRPGSGDSGRPHSSRTVANVAREARDLLAAVAPEGPLVLVGHAQGALYTNALARLVGARVQGLVLLDPAHPDRGRLRRELPRRLLRRSGNDPVPGLWAAGLLSGLRLMRFVRARMMQAPPFSQTQRHSPEARAAMWRHFARARAYRTALAEYRARTRPADLDALGVLPPVPIVVLVHDPAVVVEELAGRGRLPKADAERVEALSGRLLRDRSSLSPVGRTETVDGSGHLIHLERPELTAARIANLVKRSDGSVRARAADESPP